MPGIFTREQMAPPDQVDMKKVRPFEGGEYLDNGDGTRSTEVSVGLNIGGKEALVPSLWMTPQGPVDLSRHEESIVRAVLEFERRSGKKFPRFNSPDELNAFAKQRSSRGGALQETLAK